ncbi:hypothetical protein QWY85_05530 [Neolewinella lacunae]|uniref:Uncharacterized protein n=1 Tax=Neolewinella lacunae TaxID=1517758 RepID=A0A923PJD6_9BACT|nr:hypothetical protein [Neolewinella lacunae]MBC6995162.1 hypothetical protein [Neolewinella lacunae]MDN3634112.1 hypothetical protein [Neolewinella lacunae]
MKFLLPFITFLLLTDPTIAQSEAQAMRQVAQELKTQLSRDRAKKVALVRLSFNGNPNTVLGKYFADELAYAFLQSGTDFEVMSNDDFDLAMNEIAADQQRRAANGSTPVNSNNTANNANSNSGDGKVDPWLVGGAAAALGGLLLLTKSSNPLAKVKHFVGGTIVDEGDEILVTFQAVDKDKSVKAMSRARFIKTTKINDLIGSTPQVQSISPPITGTGGRTTMTDVSSRGSIATWRNNSMVFELMSCAQSGQNMECVLQVTPRTKDVNLTIYLENGTRIFAAENQNEYLPAEIVLGDKSSTSYRVEKTLIANYNVRLTFRFSQVQQRINSIAAFAMHCWDSESGYYNVEFKGVSVH